MYFTEQQLMKASAPGFHNKEVLHPDTAVALITWWSGNKRHMEEKGMEQEISSTGHTGQQGIWRYLQRKLDSVDNTTVYIYTYHFYTVMRTIRADLPPACGSTNQWETIRTALCTGQSPNPSLGGKFCRRTAWFLNSFHNFKAHTNKDHKLPNFLKYNEKSELLLIFREENSFILGFCNSM